MNLLEQRILAILNLIFQIFNCFLLLVFSVIMYNPGNFSHFIKAGAGINHKHMPMKVKRTCESNGQRNSPHADCKTVHVKQSVTARNKYAVDYHSTNTFSDHIERKNQKHSQ